MDSELNDDRRGIYKDTFGGQQPWADYRLRPNQCVAMVVAPELFDPEHARIALRNVEEVLASPLALDLAYP